jgi:uncharacterized protein involved in exopolysaccharide biosynthesis
MTSQVGGIASLAGIDLGSTQSTEVLEALEVMQSWSFIETFIRENELEPIITAVQDWDEKSNTLIYDSAIYNAKDKKWIEGVPTSFELFEALMNKITVEQNVETKMVKISVEHFSPIVSRDLVQLYVKSINDYMRSRKLNQSNLNIEFLQTQLNKTSISEMKEILFSLIETETKNKMLAEARPEYAFSSVSKAMIPEKKHKPIRSRIVIFVTFLGGLIPTLYFLLVFSYKKRNQKNLKY